MRQGEPNFEIAECFNRDKDTCVLFPGCGLKSALDEASQAFLATLDRHSIADTTKSASFLQKINRL